MRLRLYPTGGSCRKELMAAIEDGVEKVTPPSKELAKYIFALADVPLNVNVGPNCQTSYSSPFGPIAGTELCCSVWVAPQPEPGVLGVVVSGLTITGPCQLRPPS